LTKTKKQGISEKNTSAVRYGRRMTMHRKAKLRATVLVEQSLAPGLSIRLPHSGANCTDTPASRLVAHKGPLVPKDRAKTTTEHDKSCSTSHTGTSLVVEAPAFVCWASLLGPCLFRSRTRGLRPPFAPLSPSSFCETLAPFSSRIA